MDALPSALPPAPQPASSPTGTSSAKDSAGVFAAALAGVGGTGACGRPDGRAQGTPSQGSGEDNAQPEGAGSAGAGSGGADWDTAGRAGAGSGGVGPRGAHSPKTDDDGAPAAPSSSADPPLAAATFAGALTAPALPAAGASGGGASPAAGTSAVGAAGGGTVVGTEAGTDPVAGLAAGSVAGGFGAGVGGVLAGTPRETLAASDAAGLAVSGQRDAGRVTRPSGAGAGAGASTTALAGAVAAEGVNGGRGIAPAGSPGADAGSGEQSGQSRLPANGEPRQGARVPGEGDALGGVAPSTGVPAPPPGHSVFGQSATEPSTAGVLALKPGLRGQSAPMGISPSSVLLGPHVLEGTAVVSATAPPPGPAPIAGQLAGPVFSLASAGPGEHVMTVSVTPENLGPVTVQAHIGADGVKVELFAPNDAGRAAIQAVLPDLRRDLSNAGIGASLDLSSRNAPPDAGGHGAGGHGTGGSWTGSNWTGGNWSGNWSGRNLSGGAGGSAGSGGFGQDRNRRPAAADLALEPAGSARASPAVRGSDTSLDILA